MLLGLALPAMLSYGQTTISGQITDREDSTALPYVSVIIYRYQSNKILAYTQTDTLGRYFLQLWDVATGVVQAGSSNRD